MNAGTEQISTEAPHILLVTTDQQRYDATGVTGPAFLRTPHFAHLCNQGIRFNRAYSDCPLCVPARTTIMTGKPAYQHGLTDNGPTRGFIDRKTSLPAALANLGYQTAAIGKMHFGPQRMRHGFHEMLLPDDYYREMAADGSACQPMRHGIGQNELYPTLATVSEAKTLTAWTAERCVDYIRYKRDPEVPFFLWCSFSKPHPPLDPPEPYYSMYLKSDIDEPTQADWNANCPTAMQRVIQRRGFDKLHPEVLRAARAAYYGLVTQIDYNLGRVLGALQEAGILRNTLILYTSDHGEYLGDHGCGAKTFFHEPSSRVPFVLRLPQTDPQVPANCVREELVSLADIYPTLIHAAGGSAPNHTTGKNLIGLINGTEPPRDSLVSVSGPADAPEQIAITEGRWKYLYFPEGAEEQLFDLSVDPLEQTDLCREEGKRPGEVIENLRKAIVEELENSRFPILQSGKLPERPYLKDSETDRRRGDFPGFSTEYKDVDTRH